MNDGKQLVIEAEFDDGSIGYGRVRCSGSWAVMCLACSLKHGWGLGTGRGQAYQRTPDGVFVKVGG